MLPLCPLRVGRYVTAVIQVLARTVDPLGSHGLFVQPAGVALHACDDGSIIRGYWAPKGAVMTKTRQDNAGLLVLRAGLGGVRGR